MSKKSFRDILIGAANARKSSSRQGGEKLEDRMNVARTMAARD
jgi:hypothetical protein